MREIKYDEPIEVTKTQYHNAIKMLPMIVAHRISDGKYYIKLWNMRFKNELQHILS